ncbi:MAG: 2-oxoglutarate dehydrogenase E1 component [Chlamydiota bacterium]
MNRDNLNVLNSEYLEELYQQYQQHPKNLDKAWCTFFQQLENAPSHSSEPPSSKPSSLNNEPPSTPPPRIIEKEKIIVNADQRIFNLVHAFRVWGHLAAKVNPIATELTSTSDVPQLQLETQGFTSTDLEREFPSVGLLKAPQAPLKEILNALKETYCGKLGVEYMDLRKGEMESWLQQQIEPTHFIPQLTIEQKQLILQHLNRSELFEKFLQTKYSGQKRFSIEGGETLIPMLAGLIEQGSSLGVEEFVIGMAHRGRLNVLSNILDKSYADIFNEFEDNYFPQSFEGSGDVKYHKGFTTEKVTSAGKRIKVTLADNPSHLESVDCVVEGMVRAKQSASNDYDNRNSHLPILIHGDAAIAGQGVVYECLQLSQLKGYTTGGTIHIIINNQIGFTTLPQDERSTSYSSDIAKAFGAPIFHVNAEDPEGCYYAVMLASKLRQRYNCDVFIDLNCYRKWGHNENDEPSFTQPKEYEIIRKKKPIRDLYREQLIKQGIVERYLAERLEADYKDQLQRALEGQRSFIGEITHELENPVNESDQKLQKIKRQLLKNIDTTVSAKLLKKITTESCRLPQGFQPHKKLQRVINSRHTMIDLHHPDKPKIDWSMAEQLALGSLLWEGRHVRMSGQDCLRGTFSQRHAAWVDQDDNSHYFPLSNLKKDQGRWTIYNSPLSEYGVLAFEYGYSLSSPESLTLWEAQFGDFSNGAQIIFDHYITTGEQKWGHASALTILLPHGYEGQGPEHSSARIERFLQLAGDYNILIAYPSTPAQYFHLLRRQALLSTKKPLFIFTPKSLLRHPRCTSSLNDLTERGFSEIIDDPESPAAPSKIVFCTGKIYYELLERRHAEMDQTITIIRIEQLYPLATDKLRKIIQKYRKASQFFWVQEEPSNMGAWKYLRPKLEKLLSEGRKIKYVGRPRSASPAAGSYRQHQKEQAEIIDAIFGMEPKTYHEFSIGQTVRG